MSHVKESEHLKITLEAIKSATNNFAAKNCIWKGGFRNMYKGEINRLDSAFGQENHEFWKEITLVSLHKHENLVILLGFCDEKILRFCDDEILMYEFMYKKTLDLHLNSNDLTWTGWLKICIWMTGGLEYLHNLVETILKSIAP